jgi:hypothetical protein
VTETYTVAEWSEMPYTDHRKRGAVVEHRVRLIVYDAGSIDVLHQVRGDDDAAVPAEWNTLVAYEYRNGNVTRLKRGKVLRS